MDRVFAVHAGSREFDSHWQHMSERFFQSKRPGYLHPVCSELEKVVSEWRSVIAVSLNIGGSICRIKPAKLYMCTQNTTHTEVMCLIWVCTLGQWPHKTSITGTNKQGALEAQGVYYIAGAFIRINTVLLKNAKFKIF